MNREQQPPATEVGPSNGRNVRKRPRPKISLAGIQISAPPEYQFHTSPTAQTTPDAPAALTAGESHESGVASDFSRPSSMVEVTKVTSDGTNPAEPLPVEETSPATPPHEACHVSIDADAEHCPSNNATPPETPDSRKERSSRSIASVTGGHESSTPSEGLEQTPPHATNIFRNKKVHSLSDESSPKAAETLDRSNDLDSAEEQHSFQDHPAVDPTDAIIPTPELETPNEEEQHRRLANASHDLRTSESWEECMLMERLDRNITMAEEDDILMRLDLEISTAEEEYILQKLQEEIEKDEAAAAAASAAMEMELDDDSQLILPQASWEDEIPNQSGEGQSSNQNSQSDKSQKVSRAMESSQLRLDGGYEHGANSLSGQIDAAHANSSSTTTMGSGRHEKSGATTPSASVKQRDTIKILLTRKAKKGAVAFTENDFQLSFLPCFRSEIEKTDPAKLIDFGYTIRPNRNNGEYVFDLVAKGERSVLDTLLRRVKPWVKYRLTMAKLQQVIKDGDSHVFDLYARPEKLGITVKTFDVDLLPKQYRENDEGAASFEVTKLDGQIPDILGLKAIKSGAAIIAADGMAIGTASDLQEYLNQKIEKGAFVILTFCYDKKTNLDKAARYLSNLRRMRDEVRPPIALKSKLETESKTNNARVGENPTFGGDQILEYPTASHVLTSALPKNPPLVERAIDEAVIHILENPRSVIVELLMPTEATLGAKLYFKGTKSSGFLHHFHAEGPLARALGKQFGEWGAVLWTVNGTKIKSAPDFKTLKDQARNSKHYKLGLLCYDGIDLSGVDRTVLCAPPRRQNGEKYPMHLHPPDSGVTVNQVNETLDDKEQPATSSQSSKPMTQAISVDAESVVHKPSTLDPEGTEVSVAERRRSSSSVRTNKGLQLPINSRTVTSEAKSKKNEHTSKRGSIRDPVVEEASSPEATKVIYLPFRVKAFGDHVFFDETKFEKDFMEGFRDEIRKEYPSKLRGFEYSLSPDTARPDVYKLSASGDSFIVDELMKRAMAWNRFTSATTKLEILFNDPNSIVVEFTARATSFLGISFLNVHNLSQEHRRRLEQDQPGVWFGISDNQGVVVQKVGREVSSIVAAIVAVNGSVVTNEQQFHEVMNKDKDLDLVFTICVHKHTPLDRYKQGLKICQLKETEYYDKFRGFSEPSVGPGPTTITEDDFSFLEYPPPGFELTSALPSTPPLKEEDIEIAIQRVLSDDKSVEVELSLPITGPLGAQLCYPKAKHVVGWLHRFRSGGTLSQVFGKAYGDWGAAVIRVNGKTIDSITRFREEIDKNMQPCRLTLLCFDGVDLSEMDRSKVAGPPRRRNGQKYPMHLYPKSSSIASAPQTEHEVAKRKRSLPINEENASQKIRAKASSKEGKQKDASRTNDGPFSSQSDTGKSTSLEPLSKKLSGQTLFDSHTIPKKRLPEWNPSQLVQVTESATTHENDRSGDDVRRYDKEGIRSPKSPRGKRKVIDSLSSGAIDLSTLPPPKLRRTESQAGGKSAIGYETVAKYHEFDKTFNSNEPLGAYFVTERIDGRNYCKVWSIQMGGQAFRENRIHKDTIVDSVVTGSRRDPIRTSKQLKTLYEIAKKSRSGLTLVFKTLESSRPHDPSHVDKNWSHDGKWEGGGLGGWAGGAIDAWSKVSNVHVTKSFATTHHIEAQVQLFNSDTSLELPVHDSYENKASSSSPNDGFDDDDVHHEEMDDQSHPRRKSVTFFPPQGFTIELESETGEPMQTGNKSTSTSLSRLLDAINNKTCQELISILESGACHDAEVVEKGLQECYNEVKTKINHLSKDPESETESKALADLHAKRKVLNIYINSTLLLEKALNLEHWGSFELRVANADVRFSEKTNKIPRESVMVSGKIKLGSLQAYGGKMENLGELKPESFQEFIVWDEAVNPKVKFTNNPHILEPRHLQIELFTSHKDNPNAKPEFLCMFQLPLDTISEGCPNYETSASIEIPVMLPNDNVKSAELTVEVQRVRTDHNYVRRKSDEVASRLSEQIDFIGRFKKDYEDELVFAANIEGRNGKSLLHAAVHLRNQTLVKKLADLGATFPSNSGESENPLTKAMNQRDRAKKKLQEKVSGDEVDENAKRAYSESLAESEAIVDILKTMASSSNKT